MKGRRDRIDVIISILKAIEYEKKGAKPTHVLYKSNLSHKLLKQYLIDLKKRNAIVETDDKLILLTEKGRKFLRELKKMKRFIESFGL